MKNEVSFNGKEYMTLPLQWSNELNFGMVDYTVSVWFQTARSGTLFSKIAPSLTTFDDSIKTVYIEGGFINVKLSRGTVYKILTPVTGGSWHHLTIVVKQSTPSDM